MEWKEQRKNGDEVYGHLMGPPGVFFAYGNHIRSGVQLTDAHIRDVAPTLFYLVGLPLSEEIDGKLMADVIDPGFLAAHPPRYIPTFEAGPPTVGGSLNSTQDAEMLENLRALGYIE